MKPFNIFDNGELNGLTTFIMQSDENLTIAIRKFNQLCGNGYTLEEAVEEMEAKGYLDKGDYTDSDYQELIKKVHEIFQD